MTADSVMLAQLEVHNCGAELYVNEIPVLRLVAGAGMRSVENLAVEHFLVPGRNTLELLVEPGATPRTARSDEREEAFRPMKCSGRLFRVREGEQTTPGSGVTLVEVSFAWSDGTTGRRRFPISSSSQADLGEAHGRWAWQDAPQLVAGSSLDQEARAVVEQLAAAIRAQDSDRFWQLRRLATADVVRAYAALTDDTLRSSLAEFMERAAQSAEPVVTQAPEAQDFRIVAGGRLLELIDKNWSPSLRIRNPGSESTTPFRILLARIGGQLRVAR